MEGHIARDAGADRDREVDVRHRRNTLLPDHTGDLGALLGRELRARAGLARSSRALARSSTLRLGLHAVLALGLLVTARPIRALGRGLVTLGLIALRRTLITLCRALAGRLALF